MQLFCPRFLTPSAPLWVPAALAAMLWARSQGLGGRPQQSPRFGDQEGRGGLTRTPLCLRAREPMVCIGCGGKLPLGEKRKAAKRSKWGETFPRGQPSSFAPKFHPALLSCRLAVTSPKEQAVIWETVILDMCYVGDWHGRTQSPTNSRSGGWQNLEWPLKSHCLFAWLGLKQHRFSLSEFSLWLSSSK